LEILLVFPPGGMNSWFLYEDIVFLMGPFSANIMNHLEKLIMALVMVLGSGTTAPCR
jgi:hypothetical protein